MSPLSDIGREHRNTSLRKSSGKKPEGQAGYKDTTLKMIDISDLTEKHVPLVCENCGSSLSDLAAIFQTLKSP